MSIRQTLYLAFETEVFDTAELAEAERLAGRTNGELFCWKTSGLANWLEKGLSRSDVLGIVVLPRHLPDYIDMPDDTESED